MAQNITLTNLANLQNETTAVTAINANNATITTAFVDILSRSGIQPNTMGSNLDMNSNHILNLPAPGSNNEPLRLIDGISASAGAAISSAILASLSSTLNIQSGTTYTLQASDNNKIISINNASPITVTLPNSLPVGFTCILEQEGAGQVAVTPAAGATFQSALGDVHTATQYSLVYLFVLSNGSGINAAWRMGGDMAP